jgi:hypothetical protein
MKNNGANWRKGLPIREPYRVPAVKATIIFKCVGTDTPTIYNFEKL